VITANPPVEVITAGTDWPAIWTGIVGVVGIAASYFQNKSARKAASDDLTSSLTATTQNLTTSIGAEDLRAERAEKLRVYAKSHAAFLAMLTAVLRQRTACIQATTWEERMDTRSIVDAPREAMYEAVSEVRLIAPASVGNLAAELQGAFLIFIEESYKGDPHPDAVPPHAEMQERLYSLMRADLGVQEGRGLAPAATEVPRHD
jgi:hypothetical protein